MEMNPKISERKQNPCFLSRNYFLPAPYIGHNRKKENIEYQSFSLSLVRRPPLSRPPHHRLDPEKAFLHLYQSDPQCLPHVRPVLTVTLVRQLDNDGTQTVLLSR